MKQIAILYTNPSPAVDAIKYRLSGCKADCLKAPDYTKEYDLTVILSDYEGKFKGNALRCHHSLLPAFNSENPEKEAILAGVKVTGITIYYTETKKIIAQYPVFINNDTHYDGLKRELDYLEQVLYPIVVKKVLNNEVFEVKDLISKGCAGGCGGCSSCSL